MLFAQQYTFMYSKQENKARKIAISLVDEGNQGQSVNWFLSLLTSYRITLKTGWAFNW
jgi:hypothetical protein